jgi:hypothetical protein
MAESNGGPRFDWRMAGLVIFAWIGSALIQWGTTSATLTDHARRLDIIERRMEERSIAREEYEKRHEDLARRVEENRRMIQDLQQEAREARRREGH